MEQTTRTETPVLGGDREWMRAPAPDRPAPRELTETDHRHNDNSAIVWSLLVIAAVLFIGLVILPLAGY